MFRQERAGEGPYVLSSFYVTDTHARDCGEVAKSWEQTEARSEGAHSRDCGAHSLGRH